MQGLIGRTLVMIMNAHLDDQTDIIAPATAKTLSGLFRERVARTPDSIGYREWDSASGQWRDFSWRDMARLVARYHAALAKAGLGEGDRVAVQLPNGIDWVAFDIAAMAAGLIGPPTRTIVSRTPLISGRLGAKLILVGTWERWGALAALRQQFPAVKHVWVRETDAASLSAFPGPPAVTSLADALPTIADAPRQQELDPHATATLIYTSGTTGLPKGVMLTHFAILWNCEAATKFIPPFRSDVFLSFLPLAHAFERTLGYYLPMMGGATVAYARSVETLRDDLLAIRPTIFLAVPRIYERVHEAIRRGSRHTRSKVRWFVGPRRLAGSFTKQSGAEAACPGWRGASSGLSSTSSLLAACWPLSAAGCGSLSVAARRCLLTLPGFSWAWACRWWRATA
jgi:long-chain acyl-CoA synthetase